MNQEQNKNSNQFISGIYNYCNRWCQRCEFTSRCMLGAIENEIETKKNELDNGIASLEDIFEKYFTDTKNSFYEKNMELDFDSEDTEEEESFIEERKIKRLINESSDCAEASKKYISMVNEWFNNQKSNSKKSGNLEMQALNSKAISKIVDSIEVVQWYQYQIYVKVMRALSGEDIDVVDDLPKDSDGSAKVALIGIDSSISAWENLLLYFSDEDKLIFTNILHLIELQHTIEKKFPNARSFIRPGFDED